MNRPTDANVPPPPGPNAMVGEPFVDPALLDLMGRVLYLCAHAPIHRQYTVMRLEETFFPAMSLRQFRYYERDGKPIGFVTWGWFTDVVSERYAQGRFTPPPEEWNRGTNLWFSQFLAPFGQMRMIMRDLTHNVFPEHRGRSLRRSRDGDLVKVAQYFGTRYRELERQRPGPPHHGHT